MPVTREARNGLVHLDLLSHGDVAVLTLEGRRLVFICGIPRAVLDEATGEVKVSAEIAGLPSCDWHLKMIREAIPTPFRNTLATTPQSNLDYSLPYIRGNFTVQAEWERRR